MISCGWFIDGHVTRSPSHWAPGVWDEQLRGSDSSDFTSLETLKFKNPPFQHTDPKKRKFQHLTVTPAHARWAQISPDKETACIASIYWIKTKSLESLPLNNLREIQTKILLLFFLLKLYKMILSWCLSKGKDHGHLGSIFAHGKPFY